MKNILIFTSTSKNILNLYKNFLVFNFKHFFLNYLLINLPTKKNLKPF